MLYELIEVSRYGDGFKVAEVEFEKPKLTTKKDAKAVYMMGLHKMYDEEEMDEDDAVSYYEDVFRDGASFVDGGWIIDHEESIWVIKAK